MTVDQSQAPQQAVQALGWLVGQAISNVNAIGEVQAMQDAKCVAALEGATSFLEASMSTLPDQCNAHPQV
jgi:hypothetical protein